MRTAKEAVRHGRGLTASVWRSGGVVAKLGTAWSLCVWMLPQLVLMIISISQLILIKVIITWVVTILPP